MPINKIILTSLLISNSLLTTFAMAEKNINDCHNSTQTQSNIEKSSRCLDGVIAEIDRELQTWVNLHTFDLEEKALVNGRYSALKMFKRSQSNFSTFRENNCRWQYLAISPEIGAGLAYKKCYILLSQSRINELGALSESKE
jgi:uncharacterized protein YecT (DUF1311 family)